jgi:MoaA/NifB/PqqE/SkfB family radical SAM enzyme
MGKIGVKELSIIGGEAFLRRDWLEIIRRVTALGIYVAMQTGGYNLTLERLRQAREASLRAVGFSIDGLAGLHDQVRGVKSSFGHAFRALSYAQQPGLDTMVDTRVGAHPSADLPALPDILIGKNVKA